MQRLHHFIWTFLIPVCILGGSFGATARAADGAPDESAELELLRVRGTFGPQIVNQVWMPVQAQVRNKGNRARKVGVAVTVRLGGERQQRVRYVTSAEVPAQAKRTVNLAMIYDLPPEAFVALLTPNQKLRRFAGGFELPLQNYRRDSLAVSVHLIDRQTGARKDQKPLLAVPVHPDEIYTLTTDERVRTLRTDEEYTLNQCDYVLGEHDMDVSAFQRGADYPYAGAVSTKNTPGMKRAPHGVRVTHVRVGDLPPRWALYEGVNTLFLGSLRTDQPPASGLTPQQRRSLLRWVRSGGRLVIIPAHSMELYQHPFWRQLLPVHLLGTRLLGQSAIEAIEKRTGYEFPPIGDLPPLIAEAAAGAGKVMLETEGHVLLAQRKVGGGEVWFSALTGAMMASWRGGPEYWSESFAPRPDPVPGLKNALAADSPKIVSRLAGAAAPEKTLIVRLIAAYIILSVSALLVARLLGHPEMGWPVVLLIAVVETALAMASGMAVHRKVGYVAGEVGVTVLGEGESHASVTSFVGLHSPREHTTDIRWPNPDTLATAQPISADGGMGLSNAVTVRQQDRFSFPSMTLRPGELQLSRAMTLVHYQNGVRFEVGLGPEGVEGQVVNQTGKTLHDCLVRFNRRTYRLGNIADGATRNLENATAGWDLRANPYAVAAGEESQLRQWILADCLHHRQRRFEVGGDTLQTWPVSFYGWTDTAQAKPVPTDIEGTPRHRALQLLALPEPRPTVRPGPVRVPAGTCGIRPLDRAATRLLRSARGSQSRGSYVSASRTRRIAGMKRRESRGVWVTDEGRADLPMEERIRPPGWASGTGTATGIVQFVPPAWLRDVTVDAIDVLADIRLSGVHAEVAVRKPGTTRFRPLLTDELLEGRVVHSLDNVADLLGPNGELPEFRIRIGLHQDVDTQAVARWQIREFDVRLAGQMQPKRTSATTE